MDTRFAQGLSDNTRKSVIELLNNSLADMINLSLAVKQAHWTLKGEGFIGVHEMLDDVALRVNESVDTIAERIQIIGGQAQGTLKAVNDNSKMKPYPSDISEISDHIKELTKRFSDVGKRIRDAIDEAGDAGDEDTADLFTGVSRQIDKDAWFIGANVKK
jgi:starvation-inducible DNA-binding protein